MSTIVNENTVNETSLVDASDTAQNVNAGIENLEPTKAKRVRSRKAKSVDAPADEPVADAPAETLDNDALIDLTATAFSAYVLDDVESGTLPENTAKTMLENIAAAASELKNLDAEFETIKDEKRLARANRLEHAENISVLDAAKHAMPEPAPIPQNADSTPIGWEHAVDTLTEILTIELESIERGTARYVDFCVELIGLHEKDKRSVNLVLCKVQDKALASGENGAKAWGRISDNLRQILKNRGYSFLSTRDSRINFRTDGKDRFALESLGEKKVRLAAAAKVKEDQKLAAAKAAVVDSETAKLDADKEVTEQVIAARILEECARLGLDPLKIAALLTGHDA